MNNLQAKIQVMEKRAAGASALLRKAGQYDENKHPRNPKGSGRNAGRFAPKGGGASVDGSLQNRPYSALEDPNFDWGEFDKFRSGDERRAEAARRLPDLPRPFFNDLSFINAVVGSDERLMNERKDYLKHAFSSVLFKEQAREAYDWLDKEAKRRGLVK